ncbi:hypothetical protein N657DRAFT_642675 [Parathielavia appendiculata]|uniref:Uncharacterized protein n=1 Tax=Parathielavia appendiculata TaxID=2587402 RepID=A0AAN6U3X5_9PEZI|nr:hypothetical protein N657DRAFT_642675 [Parathielavia appendiculata]
MAYIINKDASNAALPCAKVSAKSQHQSTIMAAFPRVSSSHVTICSTQLTHMQSLEAVPLRLNGLLGGWTAF